MAWLILALVGVSTFLLIGAFGSVMMIRRHIKATPEVFRCKIRVRSRILPRRWPRRSSYARWVHDVLVVRSGLALTRISPLPVRAVPGSVEQQELAALKCFGPKAAILSLRLDDGQTVEVATSATAEILLPGPYLLALVGSTPTPAVSEHPGDPGR
jgi:hypothetical protein